MKVYKVFIVGHEGTTGLRIHERLAKRMDIELLSIAEVDRKNPDAIKALAAKADLIFLCLPDAASREIVALTKDLACKVIDASTAFRTDADWAYGFPELGEEYAKQVATNRYIANPGCHASGMIAILKPLVEAQLVPADYPLSITSLTGYSGGGKKMISQYEAALHGTETAYKSFKEGANKDSKSVDGASGVLSEAALNEELVALKAPRQYGLGQMHKHLKEVVHTCGLSAAPIFLPIVDDYYSGMEVTIGFHSALLQASAIEAKVQCQTQVGTSSLQIHKDESGGQGTLSLPKVTAYDVWCILKDHYKDSAVVKVADFDLDGMNKQLLSANAMSGLDSMILYVTGNDERILVHALFDNLGKGASGAAVENMNIALGLPATTGLVFE